MTYATTFSGIAGWEIGLNACGWELLWQCECDYWCRALLKERFGVPIYSDIRTLADENPPQVDVLIGSPPCQPFSVAGAQRGVEDERHLYPSFIRAVGVLRPKYVLMEQVPAILSSGKGSAFGGYVGGLAALGYDLVWHSIPACAIGAPHRRDRVWIIAHSNGGFCDGSKQEIRSGRYAADLGGENATDPSCDPRNERRTEPERLQWQAGAANGSGQNVAHASSQQTDPERRTDQLGRNSVGWEEQAPQQDHGQAGDDRIDGCSEDVSNSSRLLAGWKEQWIERERTGESSEPVGEDASNASVAGLQERGRPEWEAGTAQDSAGMDSKLERCGENVSDPNIPQCEGGELSSGTHSANTHASNPCWRQPEPNLGGVVNGISTPLDSHHGWLSEPQIPRTEAKTPDRVNRLKSLGNAVVPQIPYLIGQAINAIERENYEH